MGNYKSCVVTDQTTGSDTLSSHVTKASFTTDVVVGSVGDDGGSPTGAVTVKVRLGIG